MSRTLFDRRGFGHWTPLTVRGREIFGHLAAAGPVQGQQPSLRRFLTQTTEVRGRRYQLGSLTAGGRHVATVAAWFDRYGVACSGVLAGTALPLIASACRPDLDPWPVWELDGRAAHLVGVELDRSHRPLLASGVAADVRRRHALAVQRITDARRENALSRIEKARR